MPHTLTKKQLRVSLIARKIEARLDQLVKRNWGSNRQITARGAAEIIDEELASFRRAVGAEVGIIERGMSFEDDSDKIWLGGIATRLRDALANVVRVGELGNAPAKVGGGEHVS